MKTVSFRLTDKQHYYLTALAKCNQRSVEHLLWLAIPNGIDCHFSETAYYLKKLQCDFNDKDCESMANYPLAEPSFGSSYEDGNPTDEIEENVLADINRTFEAEDAAFDLDAELERTAALHAKRKADYESKKAAEKKQQEESK